MHVTGKKFGKTCRKAVRDTVFPICGLWSEKIREAQNFLAYKESPPAYFPSILGHSDLPIKRNLRKVLGLLTIMILKRRSESIFFQSNKSTTCKIKDRKEITNSLMMFELLKIIHPFQCKKYLRSYCNLNCNPQKFVIVEIANDFL